MSLKQHLGVSGLATDPNRLPKGDDGALSVARECVIRRAGFVEPRPGFREYGDGEETSPLTELRALIPFGGDVLHVGSDVEGDFDPFNAFWPTAEEEVRDGNAQPLAWQTNAIRGVEARNNLYLTTADGVRRLMTAQDADALLAGLIPPTLIGALEDDTGEAVPDGQLVAYRAIMEAKLSNGLVIRSAPTGRVVYKNTSGGPKSVAVLTRSRTPEIPGAEIRIKIYRSYSTTSDNPADELFLAIESPPLEPADDHTELSYVDTLPNVNLGEALYTNPRQEGIARQNIRPPACQDIALHNNSLFFANISRHARMSVRWREGGDLSGEIDGIGTRTIEATRTEDSAVLTDVSEIATIKIGMLLVTDDDFGGSLPVWVKNIDSGIELSEEYGGTTDGSPVELEFVDALWVMPANETEVTGAYAFPVTGDVGLGNLLATLNAGDGIRNEPSAVAFGVGVSEVSRFDDLAYVAPTAPRVLQLEAYDARESFTVFATHGHEYVPSIPEFSNVVAYPLVPPVLNPEPFEPLVTAEPEVLPNHIGWTKPGEPEHHMLAAIEGVGHQANPIARIVSARSALWILKTVQGDGLYRLSGFGELSGWRIDKVNTDMRILSGALVTAFDDVVYGWTDKGLAAISDAGPINLSRDLIGKDTAAFERRVTPDTLGGFAVANPKDHEILFGLPATEDNRAEVVYVYNLRTGAFTTWFHGNPDDLCCAAYADELLWLGTTNSGLARTERPATEDAVNADLQFACVVDTVDEETGEIELLEAVDGFSPTVGDLFVQGDLATLITAVTSATVFTVDDAEGIEGDEEDATIYVGYESRVIWLPKSGEGPAVMKRHTEALTHWDSLRGTYSWQLLLGAFIGSGNSATQSYQNPNAVTSEVIYDHRALVGRQANLASRLLPGFVIRNAGSKWRCGGISLVSEPVSTRVSR